MSASASVSDCASKEEPFRDARFYSEELEGAILLRRIEFGRNYSFALQEKDV